ncbi:MAG: shikimate kinase [Chloroflexi bacterium]|nr:MAG: shikimate kinase [Chloroflexota bacterium]TME89482.1 MAG: shikimate kinase [Chloroflexota bacterium]
MGWTDHEEADASRHMVAGRARVFDRPIALAGFMGVGKSTLGKLLADALHRDFFDTDREIERRSGRTPNDFFANGEEAEFRRIEAQVVRELVRRGPVVISLGGGALLDPTSRKLLQHKTALVHLHVSWTHLRVHLSEIAEGRPLLKGKSVPEIHRMYLARHHTYQGAALRITVSRVSIDEAMRTILTALDLVRGPTTLTAALPARARFDVASWDQAWLRRVGKA